jgi:hypothetical protein
LLPSGASRQIELRPFSFPFFLSNRMVALRDTWAKIEKGQAKK